MYRQANKLIIPLLLLSYSPPLTAREQTSLLESSRAYGRGKTYVAAHDSDEAIYLNPATLAEPDISYQLRWFQFDGTINSGGFDLIGSLLSALSEESGAEMLKTLGTVFQDSQNYKGQLQIIPMRFGAFEITPFVTARANLDLSIPPLPELQWGLIAGGGIGLSYAYTIRPNLHIGTSLKPTILQNITADIAFLDLLDLLSEQEDNELLQFESGFAFSIDLGLIWTPNPSWRLGLTLRNLADSFYDSETPELWQTISAGILWHTTFDWFDIDYLFDYHDILNRHDTHILRHFNLGMEIGQKLFSRDNDYGFLLGINEGYISSGIFLDLYFLRIDWVNYGVEIGETPGQQQARRWSLAMRSTLTF